MTLLENIDEHKENISFFPIYRQPEIRIVYTFTRPKLKQPLHCHFCHARL